jgi:predicted ATPase/class 3 adenylate cyclase
VTFLFSDIEGSTRLWDEHPAAMRSALERHDELLRNAIESHDGVVVKSTGDGTMAVFSHAPAGAAAARAAQQALVREPWGPTGPLRVRMALHTGVAHERDGDYFGPTLNRAARLMSAGHGGQVLVSEAAAGMLRDGDFSVVNLGEHRLRDLSRPERVFQLTVPGLPGDFPPLRTLDVLPTNLPVQRTTFIGRDDELARLRKLIGDHRVVTIIGVGGVGKTRLALQAAAEVIGSFRDGTWLVELASVADADTMMQALADVFRVGTRPDGSLEDSVAEHLRPRELLLVLDNCEHLLDAAARFVDRVVEEAPETKVVATSREALAIEGEHTMPLRSMSTAASDDVTDVEESDAVRLFVERAAEARDDFVLDASTAPVVNTICRRLDGIPLAIELAAARTVSLSPVEIDALLDERFRLLTGGRRGLERHQTLRAAVEWSYDLLGPAEAAVFARLSVFSGGFDGPAARDIVTDETVAEWDVIDALDALVRKSMVAVEPDTSRQGTRYQMLETMRQYALERLGDADSWRKRHCEYFAAFAATVQMELLGTDEFAWRARLEADTDNVRAAAMWALSAGELQLALRIITALCEEVAMRNPMLLGNAGTTALPFTPQLAPSQRVIVRSVAALEAYARGEMTRARELADEAVREPLPLEPAGFDPYPVYRVRNLPGFFRSFHSLVEAATPEAEIEALELKPAQRARLYEGFAHAALEEGDRETAARFSEVALTFARASKNPSSLVTALYAYGAVLAGVDDDRALDAFDEAIAVANDASLSATAGAARFQSALIFARRGDLRGSLLRLRDAVTTLVVRGRTPELDGLFGYAIELLTRAGATEAALVVIGAVLDGTLSNLRDVPLPHDRTPPDVRALRDIVGRDRFNECVSAGAGMRYDELVAFLTDTLVELTAEA